MGYIIWFLILAWSIFNILQGDKGNKDARYFLMLWIIITLFSIVWASIFFELQVFYEPFIILKKILAHSPLSDEFSWAELYKDYANLSEYIDAPEY